MSHAATPAMPPSQHLLPTDEDCNLPSEERLGLLERLQLSLGDVPLHFWAGCHLGDLQALKLLVQTAELNPNIVKIAAAQAYTMVTTWNQAIKGSRSAATTPRSSPTLQRQQQSLSEPSSSLLESSPQDTDSPPAKRQKTSLRRSKLARDKAKLRDNSRCVLDGSLNTEVAHIYPFYLLPQEEDTFGIRHVFWRMLQNFWPREKITAWEAEIFPDGPEQDGLETPRNLITLSVTAHAEWNKGGFALKPVSISEDNKTLMIQFFWQSKQPSGLSTINLTTIPISTRNLDNNSTRLFDYRHPEFRWIRSGDLIELTTDHPEARPLPSMALLEMQWFLQRVMGMAGAADDLQYDEFHFSDYDAQPVYEVGDGTSSAGRLYGDDGDVSNLGLDEEKEESFLSNVTGPSDPDIPDSTGAIPSMDTPKHSVMETAEMAEMEDLEERFRDRGVM